MPGPRWTDIRRFDTIDSTNRYLVEEARAGAPEGVVVVAGHQSAGRGRLGRRWEAPAGTNLLVSILLRPELPAEQRHLAAAVVALAAAEAVEDLADLRLGVKWPNDLLAPDGRKVAGVLAEGDLTAPPSTGRSGGPSGPRTAPAAGSGSGSASGQGSGSGSAVAVRPAIVVGIGVNVNWPGSDADLPVELVGTATSLRQLTGRPVDPDEILHSLLDALEPRLDALGTIPGRIRQADELRSRCVTLGTAVRIELADSRFEGRAVDVTPEGHLVVETATGLRTVVAGDVVHVRPPA
jgi:BirA family biotin operon repressor/biotin-[acetyl-CoA-carboxylase] ligase